ncbi:MAG: hypothetical protein J6Y55_00825 [Bacteroidales bacterium]|nr:hypothetical protein [Bacteroidales bacterium]
MKRLFLNIIVSMFVLVGYSQDLKCGFPYSDADIVALKAHKNDMTKSVSNVVRYFPIQHHIIRHSDGTGGLSPSSIAQIEQNLNEIYASANVQFYSCDAIDFIDNNTYYDFSRDDEYYLVLNYNNYDAINIYYFNSITSGQNAYAGYTHIPTGVNINFIAIANTYAIGGTVPHEMGHFFGLLHTHDTTYGNEFVDGTNCSIAGDFYCDTPADPQLSDSVVDNSCVYTGTALDPHGDYYIPDTRNIMSYTRDACRNHFSNEQLSDISYWADRPERQFFNNTLLLNNSTISSNNTYSADVIVIDNVTITNNSNVIFDACESTIIEKNFQINLGSTMQIQ